MSDIDMTDVELVSKMTAVQLRAWLLENEISPPSRMIKKDLVVAVIKAALAEKSSPPAKKKKITPSSMKINDLIAWLTEHDIEVPAKKQKKQFYVDLVTKISQEDKPKAPLTAPSKTASSVRKSVRQSASASPTKTRRKLMALPKPSSEFESDDVIDDDDDEDNDDDDDDDGGVEVVARSGSGRLRAFIVTLLMMMLIAAYMYWVWDNLLHDVMSVETTSEELPSTQTTTHTEAYRERMAPIDERPL